MTSLAPRRGVSTLIVLIFCVLLSSFARAADWPRFRGPGGRGVSDDTKVPLEWDDTKNLNWKLELPGRGFSSPIVVGNSVLVTCYSGAETDLKELKRYLVSVDRHSGQINWSKDIRSTAHETGGAAFGTQHGFASHTPVSDGQRVYVLFGNTGVLAFDLKGEQVWQKSVGEESASMFGSGASLILYKDRLIVTAGAESESIRALDKKTGDEVWKSEASTLSRSYATPIIAQNAQGEDELLVSIPFEVWSLNPDTGKLRWYAETDVDTNSVPSLVSQGGIAYVIGGRRGGRAAIRLGGQGDVTKTGVLWSTSGGSYVPSPVLHEGHLYWVNDGGVVSCIDTKTGKQVTRKRLGGQFYASVVLIRDKLYAVSRFTGTYVLEATPELKEIGHNMQLDESDFSASPAVSDGQLILRSDEYLYCIQAE